jgi:hypothetical protein
MNPAAPSCARSRGRELPPPRSSEAAAAFRTDNDVCPALAAATHADRVFEALHSVSRSEASLHRGLTYVRRKNLSCCARTIHIESRAVQRCLNRLRLLALDHLLLRLTTRHCEDDDDR